MAPTARSGPPFSPLWRPSAPPLRHPEHLDQKLALGPLLGLASSPACLMPGVGSVPSSRGEHACAGLEQILPAGIHFPGRILLPVRISPAMTLTEQDRNSHALH